MASLFTAEDLYLWFCSLPVLKPTDKHGTEHTAKVRLGLEAELLAVQQKAENLLNDRRPRLPSSYKRGRNYWQIGGCCSASISGFKERGLAIPNHASILGIQDTWFGWRWLRVWHHHLVCPVPILESRTILLLLLCLDCRFPGTLQISRNLALKFQISSIAYFLNQCRPQRT
jgi:hypothetical protein